MKLPRFHLGTFFLASLALAVFVGINLTRHWSVRVDFTNLKELTDFEGVSKHDIYSCYKHRVFELGWPAQIASSPELYSHIDLFDSEEISAVEKQELERLKAFKSEPFSEWDGKDVERLAPTVYANLPSLDEEMPPGYIHPTWDFLPVEDARLIIENKPAVAINAAVALAFTFLAALTCEFVLRRKE